MDLGHRIVAMVGRLPKRVVCMTCHSEHNYRAPKSEATVVGATRKVAGTKGPKKTAKKSARAEWETRVRSGAPLRRYDINLSYSVGDLVSHKKFGDGYVSAVVGTTKITVVFSDGERTLLQKAT